MKTTIQTIIFIFCFFGFVNAQELTITNHQYDGFHSFPGGIHFAEDANGAIWVLQNGGFDGNLITRYTDGLWECVEFEDCSNCVLNMNSDNNGIVYLSTSMGFYAWENETWVVKTDDVTGSADFTFDADNRLWFEHEGTPERLAILNSDGSIEFVDGIEEKVSDLSFGTDGLIWFQNQQEIVSTDGTNFTRFGLAGAQMVPGKNSRTYYTDFLGQLGFLENGTINAVQFPNADNGFQTTALAADTRYNSLWIGNQGAEAGITLLDLNTGESQFINSDDLYIDAVGLTDAMFVTSEGTLWAAGRFEGQVVEIGVDYISSTKDLSDNVQLYPNPTSGFLTLSIEENIKDERIRIFNQLGNEILGIPILTHKESVSIDLSAQAAGIYYVHIGNAQSIKKIFKR